MARRQYSNTATEASLTGGIGSSDTSFTLTSFAGYPAAPFTATISRGDADEEVVLVTAVSTSTVTCTRGYDGTTPKSHSAGATFIHTTIARDFDEANAHVQASSGVHGAAGSVVGTTDAQTLSNKTLIAPALQSPTATGTASFAAANFSGAVSISGVTTLASFAATSGSLTGDLSVGGTLTSTGPVNAAGGLTTTQATASAPAPTAANQLVRKDYADALGTAAATAATIMRRDANGRTAIANGAAAGDAVNKAQVEALFVTPPATRTVSKLLGSGTTVPSSGLIAGDTYDHDTAGLLLYNGAAWQPALGSVSYWRGSEVTGTAAAPPRIYTGTLTASFNGISFALLSIGYAAAGFTEAPTVLVTPGSGNSWALFGSVDNVTTTSAMAVIRSNTNITASIPVYFLAIGR